MTTETLRTHLACDLNNSATTRHVTFGRTRLVSLRRPPCGLSNQDEDLFDDFYENSRRD